MMPSESNVKILKIEIIKFIDISEKRDKNILEILPLAKEHLKHHFKSGNNKNLNAIHRCFKQICEKPNSMEQLNWYERYKEHNEIETVRINLKDRFSFIRRNGYIFVMSLLEHPKDYNYFKTKLTNKFL